MDRHTDLSSPSGAGATGLDQRSRKRFTQRAAAAELEGDGGFANPSTRFGASVSGNYAGIVPLTSGVSGPASPSAAFDSDSESESEWDSSGRAAASRSRPTGAPLRQRLRLAWMQLRLATVLKTLLALVLLFLLVRSVRQRVEDRHRSSHFSVVALLRDMRPEHMYSDAGGANSPERWQFALQWAAIQSWSAQLRGENILLFVDSGATCTFLERHIRGVQCFVIPRECFHSEYQKPRLDCIFPVAHAHSPTDTLVYLNGDVLLGSDLGRALAVLQSKRADRFVALGRRTDLPVSAEMLARFRDQDFAERLRDLAAREGALHDGQAIDLIAYSRAEFEAGGLWESFPPFLGGAPHWDAWMVSRAVLSERVTTIDMTASVMLVHVERGGGGAAGAGNAGRAGPPRVGAPFNEDLASKRSGHAHSWRVGGSISSVDLLLQGDCALGAANVKELPEAPVLAPGGLLAPGAALPPSLYSSDADPVALSPGCFLAPNPSVTDLVTLAKHASPQGFLAVLVVGGSGSGAGSPLSLALNWLCWAERIKFGHYVVLALDPHTAAKLRSRGAAVILAPASEHTPPQVARAEFLQRVLQHAGLHFILVDGDSIWLEDPTPLLQSEEYARADVLTAGGYGDDDDSDGDDETALSRGGQAQAPGEEGGLLVVRSTVFGRYFWNKVVECQRAGASPRCVDTHLRALGVQSAFTHRRLDAHLFVSGSVFFEQKAPQLRGVHPLVVRNDMDAEELAAAAAKRAAGLDPVAAAEAAGGVVVSDVVHAKQLRLAQWGLAAADPQTEECLSAPPVPLLPFPAVRTLAEKGRFQLLIRVLTYNRPESLRRLLASLSRADYLGDRVRLEISVDHPTPTPDEADMARWGETTALARDFRWPHGDKTVVAQAHNIGLVGQWTRGWFPEGEGSDQEVCLFLEDDAEVAPGFYRWTRAAAEAYYLTRGNFDPRMYGISLQRQHVVLGETLQRRFGSRTPADVLAAMTDEESATSTPARTPTHLYKYQLLGSSGGQLFFPAHWRAFLAWLSARRVDTIAGTSPLSLPCVPSLVSNQWWATSPHKSWMAWFVRFAFEQGWYTLYANFPNNEALVVNHREPGLLFSADGAHALGPLHRAVETLTTAHMSFPPTHSIPVFDFHFRRVLQPATLAWRSQVVNEKYMDVDSLAAAMGAPLTAANLQCWTIEQLVLQRKREAEEKRAMQEAQVQVQERMRAETEAAEAAAAAAEAAGAAAQAASTTNAAATATGAASAKPNASSPSSAAGSKGSGPSAKSGDAKPAAKKSGVVVDGPRSQARVAELTALSQLPESEMARYFNTSDPSTAQLYRFLSSLDPLLNHYKKSKWLSVGDGEFGSIAHWLEGQIDPEAKVVASERMDATLRVARDRLHKISAFEVLQPCSIRLPPNGMDFLVSAPGSFAHLDPPARPDDLVEDMIRVAKKGVVVFEQHETDLEDQVANALPDPLKKALAPLSDSPTPAHSASASAPLSVRASALQFVGLARAHKMHLFIKVFRDAAGVAWANEQAARARSASGSASDAAGQLAPAPMMAAMLLKKQPTKSQTTQITKVGFIAVPIEHDTAA